MVNENRKIIESNNIEMNKKDLKKLSKSQLINLLLKPVQAKKEKKQEKKNFEDLFDEDPFPEHLAPTEEDKLIEKYRLQNQRSKERSIDRIGNTEDCSNRKNRRKRK